jgi:hypothetical protein
MTKVRVDVYNGETMKRVAASKYAASHVARPCWLPSCVVATTKEPQCKVGSDDDRSPSFDRRGIPTRTETICCIMYQAGTLSILVGEGLVPQDDELCWPTKRGNLTAILWIK